MPPREMQCGIFNVPKPTPQPIRELVPPTRRQINVAKHHIVQLASYQEYLQSHIDALTNDLKQLDPDAVAKVIVPGYPPTKSYR